MRFEKNNVFFKKKIIIMCDCKPEHVLQLSLNIFKRVKVWVFLCKHKC
jgi:hypothetical protein